MALVWRSEWVKEARLQFRKFCLLGLDLILHQPILILQILQLATLPVRDGIKMQW